MGTVGEDSPIARYFGSQATEMILETSSPLLIVLRKATAAPFKNIVLALALSNSVDAIDLDKVLLFGERFKSTLEYCLYERIPTG